MSRLMGSLLLGALAVGIELLFGAAVCSADAPPQLLLQWGSPGTGPGQFNSPQGLGVDAAGNVYVTDFHRVQKFTNNGIFIGSIGSSSAGSAPGMFNDPIDVAVDPSGNIYVSDARNQRVQVFDSNMQYVREWPMPFMNFYHIALDGTGQYAYLAFPNTVYKFEAATGTQIISWTYTQCCPFGFGVGPSGAVYLTQSGGHVTKFSASGTAITTWGGSGSGDGQFISSEGVGVGSDESIYVGDAQVNFSRIEKFTSSGDYLTQFNAIGIDIAVDQIGNIFVFGPNATVQKWGQTPTPVRLETWGRLQSLYRYAQ